MKSVTLRARQAALTKLGHTSDQLSLLVTEQVSKETAHFEEPMYDYIRVLGAVKAALNARAKHKSARPESDQSPSPIFFEKIENDKKRMKKRYLNENSNENRHALALACADLEQKKATAAKLAAAPGKEDKAAMAEHAVEKAQGDVATARQTASRFSLASRSFPVQFGRRWRVCSEEPHA